MVNKNFLKVLSLGLIFMLNSCNKTTNNPEQTNNETSFLVGTYTNETSSKGIYQYTLQNDGTLLKDTLVATTENPSFLAYTKDRKFLVAVNETNSGEMTSFQVSKNSLKSINQVPSGGAHPCHVMINDKGQVLVSNYTGGSLTLSQIDAQGKLEALDIQQHQGKGAHTRQEAPHVHSSWLHHNTLIAVDLGTNALWFSKIDSVTNKLQKRPQEKLEMDVNAGPRHLAIHPKNNNWLYVINELNSTITLVTKNENGIYEKGASVSTIPKGFKEDNFCADIHISSDGRFLYASNRGHNSIAIYKVNDKTGELKLLVNELVKGNWPRNFTLSPNEDFLLVANQYSNNIVSFKRNQKTGLLTFVSEVDAPAPVCLLF